MKYFLIIILFLISNCSLNPNSEYWTEKTLKSLHKQKKIELIKLTSEDISSMTMEEYELYLEDYTKNGDYPDLNK